VSHHLNGFTFHPKAGNVRGEPIPPSFEDLVKRMLELDPDQRITPRELLEHHFICLEIEEEPESSSSVQLSPPCEASSSSSSSSFSFTVQLLQPPREASSSSSSSNSSSFSFTVQLLPAPREASSSSSSSSSTVQLSSHEVLQVGAENLQPLLRLYRQRLIPPPPQEDGTPQRVWFLPRFLPPQGSFSLPQSPAAVPHTRSVCWAIS